MSETVQKKEEQYDFPALVEELNRYLKLRSYPVGLKRFKTKAEMEAIPRIRRPKNKLAFDQVVGQARQIGWTIGATYEDFAAYNCGAPLGLRERDAEWLNGERMHGVWYGTLEDSAKHQAAMDCAPYGEYEAVAVSPLTSGRLNPPEVCLIFATPGQMIIFINGLQYRNYEKLEFSVVGESACADSWGKALVTGKPSLSLPCYAERSFGGVADDELLMAIPPCYLPQVVSGLAELSKNGLRYPIPLLGVQTDPSPSLGYSYGDKKS
jgi:uncharacterized protein (DUF169 family)